MIYRFEKRTLIRELEIFGKTYSVDFSRDELPLIFKRVAEASAGLTATEGKSNEELERDLIETKALFKEAISSILGEQNASDHIFREDNSAILHADIYTFLVEQYTDATGGL